jgi:plastocyanin
MRTALLATALTVTLAVTAAMITGGPIHVRAAQVNVDVGNFYFCDQSFQGGVCETVINAGDTVVWSVSAGTHTVTECSDVSYATCPPTGGFDSGTVSQGQQFQRTFNSAGTFYYQCAFHAVMRGRVTVQAIQAPTTPTPTPSPTAAPTTAASATPTRTPAAVPATGGYPSDGGGAGTAAGLAVLAGGLAALAGAAVVSRSIARRRG